MSTARPEKALQSLLITWNILWWWHKQINSIQCVVILILKAVINNSQRKHQNLCEYHFPYLQSVVAIITDRPNFLLLSLFCQNDNASYEDFLKQVFYATGTWEWVLI